MMYIGSCSSDLHHATFTWCNTMSVEGIPNKSTSSEITWYCMIHTGCSRSFTRSDCEIWSSGLDSNLISALKIFVWLQDLWCLSNSSIRLVLWNSLTSSLLMSFTDVARDDYNYVSCNPSSMNPFQCLIRMDVLDPCLFRAKVACDGMFPLWFLVLPLMNFAAHLCCHSTPLLLVYFGPSIELVNSFVVGNSTNL